MMNEPKDSLQNKVAKLEAEVLELKRQNEELRKELALAGVKTSMDEPITVTNYYLNKYLEIHDSIKEQRLLDVETKKRDAQQKYNMIVQQEESMDIIANKNQETLQKVKEITNQIHHKYYEIEIARYNFDEEVKVVTKKEETIFQNTIDSLQEIISLLYKKVDNQTFLTVFQQFMDKAKQEFYPLNVEIGKRKYQLVQQLDELQNYNQKIKIEIKQLQTEKSKLEQTVQVISLEAIEEMLDQLVLEMNQFTKQEEELEQLFVELKEQNLKKIVDNIRHFQVLELSNKEIAFEMDKMMMEYQNTLQTIDTKMSLQITKTAELNELLSKKEVLEYQSEMYEIVLKDYSHLESIYESVNSNISQLEEYLQMTKKAIQTKPEYEAFVSQYEGTESTLKIIQMEIEKVQMQVKELKDTRRMKALDPYARATIQNLNGQIQELETQLQKYQADYKASEQLLSAMEFDEQNLKLIRIIKNKKIVESKLPVLYNQQKELTTSVSEKYQELQKLKERLPEYDEVVEKIEVIERELNN